METLKTVADRCLPDLAVVEDLAQFLRLSRGGVRRLLRTGAIPGVKLGRRWLIERRALLRVVTPTDAAVRLHPLRQPDGGRR